MYDVVRMGKLMGQDELGSEPAHDRVRNRAAFEPCSKAQQRFPHELKHNADMCSIGPLVLEIVHEVANILVARRFAVAIAEMGEDLPLKEGLIFAVGFSTQHLERPESVLVIVPTDQEFQAVSMMKLGGGASVRLTYVFVRSLTSQTVE